MYSNLTEKQKSNIASIGNLKTVDISEKGLSERTNKVVDEGFNKSPTSDKFITTKDKSRGIAKYPLLLINNMNGEAILNILKNRFQSFEGGSEDITVMYRKENKAITLCKTRNVPDIEDLLLDYCIDYIYFQEKGKKSVLDFKANFDFESLDIVNDIENSKSFKESLNEQNIEEGLEAKLNNAIKQMDEIIEMTYGSNKDSADVKELFFENIGLKKIEEPLKENKDIETTVKNLEKPTEQKSYNKTEDSSIKSFGI